MPNYADPRGRRIGTHELMVNAYKKVRKRAFDLFTMGPDVDEVYREPGFKCVLHRRTLKRLGVKCTVA